MAEHATMRSMYWVWGWLLALTLVEVFLAYLQLPVLMMLACLMGLSIVKAALIVAYFMHLKFERLNLMLTVIPAFVVCILLLNIFFPDALRLSRLGVNRSVTAPAAEAPHE